MSVTPVPRTAVGEETSGHLEPGFSFVLIIYNAYAHSLGSKTNKKYVECKTDFTGRQ